MKQVIAHKEDITTYDDKGYIIGWHEKIVSIEIKEIKNESIKTT